MVQGHFAISFKQWFPRISIAFVTSQNSLFSIAANQIPPERCNNLKFSNAMIVVQFSARELRANFGIIVMRSSRPSSLILNFLFLIATLMWSIASSWRLRYDEHASVNSVNVCRVERFNTCYLPTTAGIRLENFTIKRERFLA